MADYTRQSALGGLTIAAAKPLSNDANNLAQTLPGGFMADTGLSWVALDPISS